MATQNQVERQSKCEDIDNWIPYTRFNTRSRLRLFCFPHAGGGASNFINWSSDLSAEIEVCPIQLPGRENRFKEPTFTQLFPLLETLEEVLLPLFNIPFAFFGHSLGALIVFEFARHLRRKRGILPIHLFVSAFRSPQLPNRLPLMHQLSEEEFLAQLRRLKATPELILQNKELLELFLPILHADFMMSEVYTYSSEDPLDCPISVFGGLQDEFVTYDELKAWREQTISSFSIQMYPGDHFFLYSSRTVVLQTLFRKLMHIFEEL